MAAEILELLGHPAEAGVFALAGLNDQFSIALEAKGPPEGFGQRGVRSLGFPAFHESLQPELDVLRLLLPSEVQRELIQKGQMGAGIARPIYGYT